MYCETCNATDPPHAPGCSAQAQSEWAADLHDLHEKGKLNGLLMAKAIALQCAVDADSQELRDFAERIATEITGAAYGLALQPPYRA